MSDPAGLVVGLIAGLILGLIALAILGLILQWLWNTTLPEVLGVREVTLFQAIKILLIASILFGGHRVVAVQNSVEKPANAEQSASASSNAYIRLAEPLSRHQADRAAISARVCHSPRGRRLHMADDGGDTPCARLRVDGPRPPHLWQRA